MKIKFRWRDFALAGGWLVLDQATKLWAGWALDAAPISIVPGFLRLALSLNRGALFGFLGDMPDPWRMIVLTLLPVAAVALIAGFLMHLGDEEKISRFALALILGGAVGNIVDRLAYGHVVDFIDVYTNWPPLASRLVDWFGTNRWPTFNIADTGLSGGATILIIDALLLRRGGRKESVGAPVP
ncbi:MAG: signal peptidase II [Candidatus Polarisedimenticolia bacterium]|nr:signal peptidase II [bacterium]